VSRGFFLECGLHPDQISQSRSSNWKPQSQIGFVKDRKPFKTDDFQCFFNGTDLDFWLAYQNLFTMNTLKVYRRYNESFVLRLVITFATIATALLLML